LQPRAGGDAARYSQVAMPRISRLDRSQVSPEVASIFDHFMKVRGNVPNMFRTVAHRPELLKTMIAHFRAVMETGTVPTRLKELLFVRTSQINRCEY
jgi:alkylhydroperoxidase family enzyme